MPPKRMLILMAMEAEAAPVIQRLGLVAQPDAFEPALPFHAFRGRPGGRDVALVTSGKDPRFGVDLIGTQPAVLQAYAALRAFAPDVVLNAGTAGGFERRSGRIGEVVAGNGRFLYHDRVIPIPGFDHYGPGEYGGADPTPLTALLGIRSGVVASGNSLDASERDREFFDRHEVIAKEMEAASLAWVCGLFGVPFYALKAITDLVDHPAATAEQFLANLRVASENLAEAVVRAVDTLV
jgi:5'-methylthioadenosine nucleosidase